MPINPAKDRYNIFQLFVLMASFVVYVYLNREELIMEEGWNKFLIYISFNIGILIAGKKHNTTKQMIRQFQLVINRKGTAESMLNETEYNMKVAAAHAGIAWERYNPIAINKLKKILAKEDKDKLKDL